MHFGQVRTPHQRQCCRLQAVGEICIYSADSPVLLYTCAVPSRSTKTYLQVSRLSNIRHGFSTVIRRTGSLVESSYDRGGVFWVIFCTKFQVKSALKTATVVRTSSFLTHNACPYYSTPIKTKFKRTAHVSGRLTHFRASFFVQPNYPPLS